MQAPLSGWNWWQGITTLAKIGLLYRIKELSNKNNKIKNVACLSISLIFLNYNNHNIIVIVQFNARIKVWKRQTCRKMLLLWRTWTYRILKRSRVVFKIPKLSKMILQSTLQSVFRNTNLNKFLCPALTGRTKLKSWNQLNKKKSCRV